MRLHSSQTFKPSASLGSFSTRNALLSAIILLGFALRVLRLDFQPLWFDEGYSLFFATRALPDLIARTALDIHPPLYYVLLESWMRVFGTSEVTARLLSVLIGVAAIPLLYALARFLFRDSRVAAIGAILLAISPLHVYYSQEVRMYGLVILLGLGSVYSFVRLLKSAQGKGGVSFTPSGAGRLSALYVLVTAAALYTQYFAAFLLAFQFIYVFLLHRDKRNLSRWFVLWFATGILYLPWLLFAGVKLYAYVASKVTIESYTPLDPLTFLFQHLVAFSVGHLTEFTALAAFSIVSILITLLGLAHKTLSPAPLLLRASFQDSPRLFLALYLLTPVALGYLVNLFYSFHPPRYERLLLFAAPAFYLLVARGIAVMPARRAPFAALALGAIALVSALSLSDFYTAPRYAKDDYRSLIAQLQASAQPGDNFLAIYPWQIGYLETYYRGAPLNVVETPSNAWIVNASKMQSDVDAYLQKNPRVWLPALQTQGRVLEDALEAYLRPRAYSITDAWFGNTRLQLYARMDDPLHAANTLAFQENFVITKWGISQDEIIAGRDPVRLWFDWGEIAATDLKLSLRLMDRNGNAWAQEDREIADGIQRIGFAIPAGMPPGEYALRLAVYHARDGAPIRALPDSTRDDILLTRLQLIAPTQPNLAAMPHRVDVKFANGMRLVGYEAPDALRPGISSTVVLYWQTWRALESIYTPALQLKDAGGKTVVATRANIAYGLYPPTEWRVGEMIRDPQAILIFGDAPEGTYTLVAALENRNGARERTKDGQETITLDSINVKHRTHYFGAPITSNRAADRFGDVARLIGYDVIPDPARQIARIVLYWQSLGAPHVSYRGFVHLYDENDQLAAQRDQIPGAGAFPTTSWVKNEYLVDSYDIALPADAKGVYKIRVGLYDANTGARIAAFDSANQFTGDIVELSTRIKID